MRILIVEDNDTIGRGVQKALIANGASADLATSLTEAKVYLGTYRYDVTILDLNLPDGYGLELLSDIDTADQAQSVLILTAQDSVTDRVAGLDAGADDYLVKPFELDELLARVRVLGRRSRGRTKISTLNFGSVTLDDPKREVCVNGQAIDIARREFACLKLLMENAETVVTKDTLLSHLYESAEPPLENAVEVVVSRLRKKIMGSCVELKTVRGVGYMLVERSEIP